MFFRVDPEYHDCRIIAAPAKYNTIPYAFGFQKDSPYLGLFNYVLKEMEEKGLLSQLHKKYESPRQVCPDMGGKPIGIESCIMAFLALLGGIGICLILMIVEHKHVLKLQSLRVRAQAR